MARVPRHMRMIIAANIKELKEKKFPGRGGSKKCADALGVTPQQWSPWELGTRGPDEETLKSIAELFGVTVDDLRREPTQAIDREMQESTRSAMPMAHGDALNGSAELVEVVTMLLSMQGEFAEGKRTAQEFSTIMRDILKYTKFVVTTSENAQK